MKRLLLLVARACLPCFFFQNVFATTIVPFPNLGEMAKAAEMVVLARASEPFDVAYGDRIRQHVPFTVMENGKGDLPPGSVFEIQRLGSRGAGWVSAVPDDPAFESGQVYLLFLSKNGMGFWRPTLMSYAVFEQIQQGGEAYLTPLQQWQHLHILPRPDGLPVEPLGVFRLRPLLEALISTAHFGENWDAGAALVTTNVAAFLGAMGDRTPPSHCTYLTDGTAGFQWQSFPASALDVHYASAGDSDCSPASLANTYTQNAVSDMDASYLGVNLNDGGSFTGFTPDCTNGSAVDGNFFTFVDNNLGGARNVVVQYNDPCNEIPNLSGCAGTLAVGGTYGCTPTVTYDGTSWYQACYGFVIVNGSVCTCMSATQYRQIMTHEMTHSLGLDHIAGSGTANMNPACCTSIQTLDVQCVDYLYAPPAMPVELVKFTGTPRGAGIALAWQTASETGNQSFILERSADGENFEPVAEMAGAGDASQARFYEHFDGQPRRGVNYYRLKQVDFDGGFAFSSVIAVDFAAATGGVFEPSPNPVSGEVLRLSIFSEADGAACLEIFDQAGRRLLEKTTPVQAGGNRVEISVAGLPPGAYLVRKTLGGEVAAARFFIE